MRRVCSLFRLRFLLLVAVGIFLAGNSTSSQDIVDDECFDLGLGTGCDVEGVSAILASTDATEIDTYSATSISLDLQDDGFEADVVGHLFLNDTNNEIDTVEGFDDGTGLAEAEMADGVELGNAYGLGSEHNLIDLLTGETDFIGTSFVAVDASAPQIDSISPTDASTETQGTLTVDGSDFIDPFTGDIVLDYSGGGVTFTLNSVNSDGTQLVVNYSIAATADTGDQSIAFETSFGVGNSVTFHIGDPTPVVQSVSPDEWQAGTDTPITVTGKYFGCNPSLQIDGPGVTGSSVSSSSDTQLQGTVTIDVNSTGGTATVTVLSHGCTGQGFVSTYPGQPSEASNTATINPVPASPIVIVNTNDPQKCQGTDLSQRMQTIYAGQQVNLRACLTSLQPGETVETATWTIDGNVVLFYSASTSKATLNAFKPPDDCVDQINNGSFNAPAHSCTVDPFFWVCNIVNAVVCTYPGTVTAVFEYTLNNGNGNSKTVTYNVLGPANTAVPITVNPDGGNGTVQVTSDQNGLAIEPTGVTVVSSDGSNGTSVGIVLLASAQLPTDPNTGKTVGSFSWARLFNNPTTVSFIQGSSPDSQSVPSQGPGAFSCSLVNPLDTNPEALAYPVTSGVAQKNVPEDLLLITGGHGLQPHEGEGGVSRLEKVYLFWTPDPVTDEPTIPIPLGAVTYHFSGAAINTLNPTQGKQGWVMNAGCGIGPGSPNLVPGTAFPIWTAKFAVQSCGPI